MRVPILTLCLLACATRAPAPPSPSEAPSRARADVVFEPLADGVWMHVTHREVPPWGLVRSNGLVVVDGEWSILVDTGWTDAQTAAILDWAAEELGRPVARAVFTHAHADKMGGVGVVRARGIDTWAHQASNALAPGRGLVPAERALTFDADGASEDLAPLVVLFPGSAHTVDNVVVGVPDAGVLFGGCLVRPADAMDLGNTADGDVGHWAAAAEMVAARFPDAAIVVPSHGDPGGPELLTHTRALAEAAVRAGGESP